MTSTDHPFAGTRFLVSAGRLDQAPADTGREAAFVGRSNAGKSSALNRITGRKSLARTSKTPGRTRLINFFAVDPRGERRLVDLPGYGFARVPREVKARWEAHLQHYLEARRSLAGLVLLMDIRHPLKPTDLALLEWSRAAALPVHILLTKADKLKHGARQRQLLTLRKALETHGLPASAQTFSAHTGLGLDEVRARIADWLQLDGA
ncbi:MAG: YihA family ribosome biogenesis GTP-binding protein [Gammaproteobacteria bacterium]|nr:MAG: YihA family ribosome biogenesis GTP-binding protein [Gammaproteobacteria bacterium]